MIGLDPNIIKKINYKLTLARIINDASKDFIYAPHINAIYALAKEELWSHLSTKLKNGTFNPSLPISMEIPKPSGFTRPGSILKPYDRMSYQLTVDNIGPVAEKQLNRSRVFSNVLLKKDPKGSMFKSTKECFSRFQSKLVEYVKKKKYSSVLKADIASYFQNINQHILINLLRSAGCDNPIVSFLEKLLLSFTEQSSRGIIQGVFPSDFLGNFYLCYLDEEYSLKKIPFLRYVDDIYSFFDSRRKAFLHQLQLIKWLRNGGLHLNEYKTKILPTEALLKEETKIEKMFEGAQDEIISEIEEEFKAEMKEEMWGFYSTTIQWDFLPSGLIEPEIDYKEVEIDATKKLFDLRDVDRFTRDKIDKFCIPVFTRFKDDYAMKYILREYPKRAHMARIFANYIAKMIRLDPSYVKEAEKLFLDKDISFEYQYIWLYGALMAAKRVKKTTVNFSIKQLRDANLGEALRAICAIFMGKFSNTAQKRLLRNHYSQEQSEYVRSAILHAVRYFPSSEKNACYKAWGGHNELNSLVLCAAKKI